MSSFPSCRLFALALLLLSARPAAASELHRLTTHGPRPSERSSPAVAALGHRVFLFGGVFDDFSTGVDTFYDDLHRFDVHTRTWVDIQTAGPRPAARAFAAAVADERGHRMMVYGGATYGPFFSDFVAHDDLWAYSPGANAWSQLVPANAGPEGRSRPALWIDGDRLYLFGGITSFFETRNDLWMLDLCTLLWTELSPNGAPGAPPTRHEAMTGDRPKHGKLTLYGGEGFDPNVGFAVLEDTWEYNLASGQWTERTPAPAHNVLPGRNYAASALLGDALVLQGGDTPGGTAGCGAPFEQNPTSEVWKYSLRERRWRQLQPHGDPSPRLKRQRAVDLGGVMYIFAGWDFQCPGPGQVWNLDVYALEL